ncbi:hypothetical protein HDU81_006956 [Chytriomyces hyalinus]|nr:hypothetical protein HDU81_006956 [Chytriomyces hyalinus]
MNILGLLTALALATCPAAAQHDTREVLEAIYSNAKAAYAERNFVGAVKNFELLKTHIPEWKDNYFNLATAHLYSGSIGQAFDVLDEVGKIRASVDENLGLMHALYAVTKYPEDAEIASRYCSIIASMLNQPNDFIYPERYKSSQSMLNICIKAAKLAPGDAQVYMTLASLLTLLKEYKAAISIFDDWLLRFGHENAEATRGAKNSLTETLVRNGNYERAFKLAMEVFEQDPSPENRQKVAYVRKIGWPIDRMAWEYQKESVEQMVAGYDTSNPMICKSNKQWRVAFNFSQEATIHPDSVSVSLLNPETAYKTYGKLDDPVFVGPELEIYPRMYHERWIHLVNIQDAFMSGHPGIIHSDCTLYTGSHHVNTDLQSFRDKEIEIREIPYRAVSIIQHQTRNYYHWMLEALPKLLLLKKHVLDLPGYEDVKIIVPEKGIAGCIDATLNMPEFDSLRDRFIPYTLPSNTRYHFPKGLHVVDWIHPLEDTHQTLHKNLWSAYWPPREIHHLVRSFFYDALKSRNRFPALSPSNHVGEIVYVSRLNTVRGFPNEAELLEYLQERFGERLRIHTGSEEQLEQVAIFTRARVVAGTHGAGFATRLIAFRIAKVETKTIGLMNYIFAQPGAALVFVPMNPLIEFCFGHIVSAMGGTHYLLTSIPGSHYHGTYKTLSKPEMIVMGNTIEIALANVLSKGEGGGAELDHEEL